MAFWMFRRRSKQSQGLRFPKDLLATLLKDSGKGMTDTPAVEENEAMPAQDPAPSARQPGPNPTESGMFNFLERKSEKRIFYSYLHQFELTLEHLGHRASRQLLNEIYRQSSLVSQQFAEPVATVSHNIISAAAWGTIYCLLGPTRMIEMNPDYLEIADEVELELLSSCLEEGAENSIYRAVYSILSGHVLCHPEVLALIDACVNVSADSLSLEPPPRSNLA